MQRAPDHNSEQGGRECLAHRLGLLRAKGRLPSSASILAPFSRITRRTRRGWRERQQSVANLSRPDGNVTGLSLQQADIASKRLELLREVVPRLRRLGIMFSAGYPASVPEIAEVQAAARTLSFEVALHEIRRAEDISPAFEALKSQADGLYVVVDALLVANSTRIIVLAFSARLPTIFR